MKQVAAIVSNHETTGTVKGRPDSIPGFVSSYSVQECDIKDDEHGTAVCQPYLLCIFLNTFYIC